MRKFLNSRVNRTLHDVYELAFSTNSNFNEHFYVCAMSKECFDENSSSLVVHLNPDEVLSKVRTLECPDTYNIYISSQSLVKTIKSDVELNDMQESGLLINHVSGGHTIKSKAAYKVSNSESNKFGLRNLVLDFDYHGYCPEDIEYYMNLFKEHLDDIFEGVFTPNFLNFTPHGCQVWWCFDELPYKAFKWLFDLVYREMVRIINNNLNALNMTFDGLQVDNSFNNTGLVRLPGSAGEVVLLNNNKYTLNQMKDTLGIVYEHKPKRNNVIYLNRHSNDFSGFAHNRLNNLTQYIQDNPNAIDDNRNNALIIIASSLAVLENATFESVLDGLMDFNELLSDKLSYREVLGIARSGWKHKYKYKNMRIIQEFRMTPEDAATYHLTQSDDYKKRKYQRQNARRRQATKDKKDKLIKDIYEFYVGEGKLNRKATMEKFNISLNTLKKYLKVYEEEIDKIAKTKENADNRKIFNTYKTKQFNQDFYKKNRPVIVKYKSIAVDLRMNFDDILLFYYQDFERQGFTYTKDQITNILNITQAAGRTYTFEDIWITLNHRKRLVV